MKNIKFFIFLIIFSLVTGCQSGFDSNDKIKLASEEAPSSKKTVNLTWNANTEPDLSGYKIYYGDQSGIYKNPLDVGLLIPDSMGKAHYQFKSLETRKIYFFSASAYDVNENESDKSDGISA